MALNFNLDDDVEPDEAPELTEVSTPAESVNSTPPETPESAEPRGQSSGDGQVNEYVPMQGPRDASVVDYLVEGEDPVAAGLLEDSFSTSAQPWSQGTSLQELSDAYTTASFWYAVSKDKKRRQKAVGDWGDESVLRAQLAEDYMEALVKSLDKALMVGMATAKYGGA